MIQHILLWSAAGLMLLYSHAGDKNTTTAVAMPVLLDAAVVEPAPYHAEFLSTANHNPLYIGPFRDTVRLSRHWTELDAYYVYGRDKENLQKPDSGGMELLVDTSVIIANQLAFPLGSLNQIQSFRAYPVLLVNTSGHAWNIGSGFHIPVILEAVDHKGNWRPIEEPYLYKCGTGMNSIRLPAGDIAITSVPVHQGSFKTRLRLRFRHMLSNVFSGSIEPTQFDSRLRKR
jgi:hypothetical protein